MYNSGVGYFTASAGCTGTGAGFDVGDFHVMPPQGISPHFGLVQGEWRGWNTGDIRNSLSNASPVVISGYPHLWCSIFCFGYGTGHEWVIDGMRDENVTTTYNVTAFYLGSGFTALQRAYYVNYNYNTTSTTTKIHQNWGWGPGQGSDLNDWYLQGVFQSNAYTYDPEKDFNHANYIIAYITPL